MPFTFEERNQDLFTMDKSYVLAHCVSTDCALGAGIAKEFRNRIPEMPDALQKFNPKVGEVILFPTRGGRKVANLFTKELYYHKPTYESLTISLIVLRRQVWETGITKIAIPQLGCGLDKLKWSKVKDIIQEVFKDEDLEIIMCYKDKKQP